MDSPPRSPEAPFPGRPVSRTGVWLAVLLLAGLGLGAGLRWMLDGPAAFTGAGGDSAAQQPVLLTIVTEPSDATVIVDGLLAGQSPVRDLVLQPGPHSLRIEKEGFTAAVQPLTVGHSRQVVVNLAPVDYARLEITAVPAGAEVWVDGNFRGKSPLIVDGLLPGFHDLSVQQANYTTHQSRYMLRAGEVRRIADITLDNRLLLMLNANLEINPRSIGNHLDLAHFYYVNNDMPLAARYYLRARELAALPMPPPPPDLPQDEINFLPQLFQDEIRRVKTEEDHHLVNFREYYGTGLDFDTFKRLYGQGIEEFKIWSEGIHKLPWVVEQAEQLKPDRRDERRAELFSDFVQLHATCGPALAGWAAAELQRGHAVEAAALYARAKALLEKPDIPDGDKPFVAQGWFWMGVAWHEAGRSATGRQLKDALALSQESLEKAIAGAGENKYLLADAQYHAALLARDRGDKAGHVALLAAAYEGIKILAESSRANPDSLARCLALQHPIQYALAYARIEENKADVAVALFRDLAANAPAESPYKEAARHAVEIIDSGKTPVDPLAAR